MADAPQLETLTEFIEKNQRMIAVIGVLSALGIFWASSPVAQRISPSVPFFCMLATLPIYWEIAFTNFDSSRSRWSVIIFVNLFTPLMLGTVWYALLGFTEDRERQLPWMLMLLFFVLSWQFYKGAQLRTITLKLTLRWNEVIIIVLNWFNPQPVDHIERVRAGMKEIAETSERAGQFVFGSAYILLVVCIGIYVINPIGIFINFQVSEYAAPYIPPDTRPGPEQPVGDFR